MRAKQEVKALAIALQNCFDAEILPNLPAESQYAGAMVRKALAIIVREMKTDVCIEDWNAFAKLIRNREYGVESEIVSKLIREVRKELSVNSPTFLTELDRQVDSLGFADWVYNPEKLGAISE